MAEQLIEDIEEDLSCSICMKRYENPKMLPCMHSFCKDCLETYAKKEGGEGLPCPTCRRLCKLPNGVEGLQTNFHFVNLGEKLDSYKSLEPSEKISASCGMCEGPVKPEVFCVECNFGLCSGCEVYHARIPQLRSHDLIPLKGDSLVKPTAVGKKARVPSCMLHDPGRLRFFCKTCSKLICRECTIVNHPRPGHEFVEVLTEFQNVKTMLNKLMQASRSQMETTLQFLNVCRAGQQHLVEVFGDLQNEVGEMYGLMIASIEEQLKEQMEQVNQRILENRNSKITDVKSSIEQAQGWVESMACTQKLVAKIIREDNAYEVLGMSRELVSSFNNLQGEMGKFKCTNPKFDVGITFSPGKIPTVNFGDCTVAEYGQALGKKTEDDFQEVQETTAIARSECGGFIVCQFDKVKSALSITKITSNHEEEPYSVLFRDFTPDTVNLSVDTVMRTYDSYHTGPKYSDIIVSLNNWLLLIDLRQKGNAMPTIITMGQNDNASLVAMCIVGPRESVFQYDNDVRGLYTHWDLYSFVQGNKYMSFVKMITIAQVPIPPGHNLERKPLTNHTRIKTITAVKNRNAVICTASTNKDLLLVIELNSTPTETEITPKKPRDRGEANLLDVLYCYSNGSQCYYSKVKDFRQSIDARKEHLICTLLWGGEESPSSEKLSYTITEYDTLRNTNLKTWTVPRESSRPKACGPLQKFESESDLERASTPIHESLHVCDDSGRVFECTEY